MKRILICAIAGAMIFSSAAFGDTVNYDVFVTTAPAQNSPNFDSGGSNSWFLNALEAVTSGLATNTDFGGGPATYVQAAQLSNGGTTTYSIDKMAETNPFNSWHDDFNPGADFGAAYAGEFGNQLAVITVITPSSQGTISLSNVTESTTSGIAGFEKTASYTATTYDAGTGDNNAGCVNPGCTGTASDIYSFDFTQGVPSTSPVAEIIMFDYYAFVGVNPSNNAQLYSYAPFSIDQTYDYLGQTETTTVDVVVPEPGTIGMLATGLFGLGALAFRRRRKA
jgi:hypothetical protein